MVVGDAHVFPGSLTPVLTQLFFPKPPTTFLTCFCRGERRKYAGQKSRLNRGSNSQPTGHESDTLTTEPPRRGPKWRRAKCNEATENVFYHFICLLVCAFVKCVIKLQEIKCTSKTCLFIHLSK